MLSTRETSQLAQAMLSETGRWLGAASGWVFALNLATQDSHGLQLIAKYDGNGSIPPKDIEHLGWQVVEYLVPAPRPVIYASLSAWLPPQSPAYATADTYGLTCWAALPLLVEDRPVGVLIVARRRGWRRPALTVLSLLAQQIAASLENARLYSEAQQMLHQAQMRNAALEETVLRCRRLEQELLHRNRELAAFNRIAETLNRSLDLDAVLHVAIDSVIDLVDADAVTIRLVTGETLGLVAHRGLPQDLMEERASVRIGQYLVGLATQSGEPLVVEDCATDPRADRDFVARTGVASAAFMPLHADGRIVGVLSTMSRRRRQFTAHDLHVLRAIASPVGTALDRARRYDAERDRARSLEDLNRLKSDFVSTVSHELRTPMAITKASLDMVATSWSALSDERRRAYLTIARQGATRLKRLLEDLLLVSRIEHGRLTLRAEPIGVAAVIEEVIGEITYQHAGRSFELELSPDLPEVMADRSSLWEIFLNLADNAAKYSGPDTRVLFRAYPTDQEVIVEVVDQGIGIASTDYDRLFRRFERIDHTVRSQTGTGLGLYISKQLVEAMGGRIWVRSQLGEGSVFSIALPRAVPRRKEQDAVD